MEQFFQGANSKALSASVRFGCVHASSVTTLTEEKGPWSLKGFHEEDKQEHAHLVGKTWMSNVMVHILRTRLEAGLCF